MPSVASKALAAQDAVRREYDRLSQLVAKPLPWSEWLWAVDIARSRTFEVPPVEPGGARLYGMFPVCDMLNHKFGSTTLRLDSAAGTFQVIAGESFAAGEQVLISYGAAGNEDLLAAYGFVDDENDMDAVEVPAAALAGAARRLAGEPGAAAQPETDADWAERVALVRRLFGERHFKIFRGGEEEDLMAAARVLCAARPDFERLRADASGAGWPGPVDLESECRAWAAVATACGELLEGFPTSVEEDEALLAAVQQRLELAPAGPARAALERRFGAVLLRALKKAVLREAAARVEYYARTSLALGRLLQPTVMTVSG